VADSAKVPLGLLMVNRASKVPIHRQIYSSLRQLILDGVVRGNLPSTRSLARDLGVARQTVVAAYYQLVIEGCIEGRSRSGTRVAPRLARRIVVRRALSLYALPGSNDANDGT
jgi:GntR family transcriptional regulator/MocR family aminotransferase